MLKTAADDISKKTIETKAGTSKSSFKTDISNTGDIRSNFPVEPPKVDDIYWTRHNELVDKVIDARKEIILKAIDVTGTTVKGIINPISVSNIDIAKIIEGISKQ